jgi:hypothetical protein
LVLLLALLRARGEEGSRHQRRVVGAGSRRRRRFCLAHPIRLRGLKNKPKFRCYASFTPKFSLLFHRSKGRVGLFRALRSATNGLPLDRKKLSRKFYQSFQKRVQPKPSNSDLSLLKKGNRYGAFTVKIFFRQLEE